MPHGATASSSTAPSRTAWTRSKALSAQGSGGDRTSAPAGGGPSPVRKPHCGTWDKTAAALAGRNSPEAAWDAIIRGGGPGLRRTGLPAPPRRTAEHHGRLRPLGHERAPRQAVDPVPRAAPLPVRVLAEVIAVPPGQPVPEELLEYRRPPSHDPEAWLQASGTQSAGRNGLYFNWLRDELTWAIAPDLEATDLREQLHADPRPELAVPADFHDLDPRKWPEGLFWFLDTGFKRGLVYTSTRQPRCT